MPLAPNHWYLDGPASWAVYRVPSARLDWPETSSSMEPEPPPGEESDQQPLAQEAQPGPMASAERPRLKIARSNFNQRAYCEYPGVLEWLSDE